MKSILLVVFIFLINKTCISQNNNEKLFLSYTNVRIYTFFHLPLKSRGRYPQGTRFFIRIGDSLGIITCNHTIYNGLGIILDYWEIDSITHYGKHFRDTINMPKIYYNAFGYDFSYLSVNLLEDKNKGYIFMAVTPEIFVNKDYIKKMTSDSVFMTGYQSLKTGLSIYPIVLNGTIINKNHLNCMEILHLKILSLGGSSGSPIWSFDKFKKPKLIGIIFSSSQSGGSGYAYISDLINSISF